MISKIEFTTRIKDFDDLWRISRSEIDIDKHKMKELLKLVGLDDALIEFKKISEITIKGWAKQHKKYPDLPRSLNECVEDINHWIKMALK